MIPTFFSSIVAPVFYQMLYMSLTALVIGMILMLIRRFADRYLSPCWKYAVWIPVLIALVLPWRPQSNLALMNTTERIQGISFQEEYHDARTEYSAVLQEEPSKESPVDEPSERLTKVKEKVASLHRKTLIFDILIPALWLFGTALIGAFALFGALRLGKKIRMSRIPAATARYENMLQECKENLGIKRRVSIVLQSYRKSPSLFGVFRPAIILPESAETLSEEHLKYIILHELSHLKRGDGIVNALLLVLQVAYWMNPLVWFLFRFIREDMELANDFTVLKGMGKKEQTEYSLSLVAVLAEYGQSAAASRMLCMADSEKNIKRRLSMIKRSDFFKKRKLINTIAGIFVIAVTAVLFLTVGKSPADQNVWASPDQNAWMSSVGYPYEMLENIREKKTPFAEDSSKISAIVSQLPVIWKGLSYDSFSLQSGAETCGLTIFYKETSEFSMTDWLENPFSDAMKENNALLLFSSIDGLEKVSFVKQMPDGEQTDSFSRETISKIFRGIPAIDDVSGLTRMLMENLRMDEFYFAHAGRFYLFETKPEDVIYRYGKEPDRRFYNQSGLTVYQYGMEYFYFNESGLYATRKMFNAPEYGVDTRDEILAKFGPPASETTGGNYRYVFYRLRQAAGEPEKYAYFVLADQKAAESGTMTGNDFSALSIEPNTTD